MEIQKYNELAKELDAIVRAATKPIALKWFEKSADVPAEAVFPVRDMGKHMAMCQVFTYARAKGMTIAMEKRDHWCWNPLIGYGTVECVPGQPQFEKVCQFIGIPDKEKAAKFFQKFPRLPLGKYEAVVVAPLEKATFEPDVIMVYATPFKVNYLVRCIKSLIGDNFQSTFDGIDSCIYCTVPSFLNNEFRVTLPDPGETERARTRDEEVILTIPAQQFEGFMDSLKRMNAFMPCDDSMRDCQLDFPRPPFYNELFDIWGLEKGEDWAFSK